jgi:hypothetical protein
MSILGKISVEMWPSTFTSLIHIVAIEKHLWGKFWYFFTVFELKSSLNNLSEGNSIARTTSILVTDWSGEIITNVISPVMRLWELTVWNFLGGSIL